MATGLVKNADWAGTLRKDIYSQFYASNWAVPLANAIGAESQLVENVIVAMLSLWSIQPITSDATDVAYGIGRGLQLDRIGKLVGWPRGGLGDAQYRLALQAKILVNLSIGVGDQLIVIAQAMFLPATNVLPLLTRGWGRELTIRMVGALFDPLTATVVDQLLAKAVTAGVKLVVEWTTIAASQTLIWNGTLSNQAIGNASGPSTQSMGLMGSAIQAA